MVTVPVAASSGVGDVATALGREREHTKSGTLSLTSRSQLFQWGDGSPSKGSPCACHSIVRTALGFEYEGSLVSGRFVSGVGHVTCFHHPQPNTSLERMHELAVYEPCSCLGQQYLIRSVRAVSRAPLS